MDRRFETKGNVALMKPVRKAEKVILERWGVYWSLVFCGIAKVHDIEIDLWNYKNDLSCEVTNDVNLQKMNDDVDLNQRIHISIIDRIHNMNPPPHHLLWFFTFSPASLASATSWAASPIRWPPHLRSCAANGFFTPRKGLKIFKISVFRSEEASPANCTLCSQHKPSASNQYEKTH